MALEGYVMRQIMDEYVIVPVGKNAMKFNGIVSTNITGAYLWEKLRSDSTEDELTDSLTEEFDVSDKDAREDVKLFLSELRSHGILR